MPFSTQKVYLPPLIVHSSRGANPLSSQGQGEVLSINCSEISECTSVEMEIVEGEGVCFGGAREAENQYL